MTKKRLHHVSIFLFTGVLSFPVFGEFYLGGSASYNSLDYEIPTPGMIATPTIPILISTPLPPGYSSPGFAIPTINVDLDQDDKDSGWKLLVGYRFNPIVSLELAYVDLGEAEAEINTHSSITLGSTPINSTFTQELELETKGFSLLGVFNYPTNWVISPYAKIGVLNWEEEFTSRASFSTDLVAASPLAVPQISSTHSEHGYSPVLGLGVNYHLSDKSSIRLEYEYIDDVRGRDIESLSASFVYYLTANK